MKVYREEKLTTVYQVSEGMSQMKQSDVLWKWGNVG